MRYFYHYTSYDRARDIMNDPQGFRPMRRVLSLGSAARLGVPDKLEEGALFGLTEPLPVNWMKHEYYEGQGFFETVLGDIGGDDRMVLLKCQADEKDDLYVAEHYYHARPDYNGRYDFKNPVTAEVKQAYWDSFVPFLSYVGGYEMPEVIGFTSIPPERIEPIKLYETRIDLINEFRSLAGRELKKPLQKKSGKETIAILGLDP